MTIFLFFFISHFLLISINHSNYKNCVADMTKYLNHEENRLKTFGSNWPHAFISPRILAKTGIFYIGPHDRVKCYFCSVSIENWEMGDNEITEHLRWSKNCPLLIRRVTTNVEPVMELEQLLPKINYDICGTHNLDRRPDAYPESTFLNNTLRNTTIAPQRADFPDYTEKTTRINTFNEWLNAMGEKTRQLSEAGFFHTQKEDRVICFSCGGGLYNWSKNDDPWEQHALWYPNCTYLHLIKGQKFIEAVGEKFSKLHF